MHTACAACMCAAAGLTTAFRLQNTSCMHGRKERHQVQQPPWRHQPRPALFTCAGTRRAPNAIV